jgi:hypothetical protein
MGVDQSDESPHKEAAKAGALVVKEKGRTKTLLANNQLTGLVYVVGRFGGTLVPFVLLVKRFSQENYKNFVNQCNLWFSYAQSIPVHSDCRPGRNEAGPDS